MHAKYGRPYLDLNVGDNVKIYRKKDLKHKAERYSVWSSKNQKIEEITTDDHGQKFYKVTGRQQPYLRHELLKSAVKD